MRRSYYHLGLAVFVLFFLISNASAQDFQRSYKLAGGGSISLKNVSGDVSIRGYEGDVVVVNGYREGRDRDVVEVEDRSAGQHVDVTVRYPSPCNCDASVRFDVRVPRTLNVNIDRVSTASGNIDVTDVRGEINVSTASGNVMVKDVVGRIHASTASGQMSVKDVVGEVSAQSASGDVVVEIARLEGRENMKFTSASGDVSVRLPSDLDADVSLSSASGNVRTDFPLEIQERRYGPGSQARGRLGNGLRSIRISTASGDVSLMRY